MTQARAARLIAIRQRKRPPTARSWFATQTTMSSPRRMTLMSRMIMTLAPMTFALQAWPATSQKWTERPAMITMLAQSVMCVASALASVKGRLPAIRSDPCIDEKCDRMTGACVATTRDDGANCDDGDGCTRGDHCTTGICGGSTMSCNGGARCVASACPVEVCAGTLGFGGPPVLALDLNDLASAASVSDLDGDGTQDLVIATYGNDGLRIFRGNGNGTFELGHAYSVGSRPSSVVAADLDGDGKPDVALTNHDSSDVLVFRNAGGGVLRAPVSYPTGDKPISVTVADVTGDGNPDLLVVYEGSQEVSIFYNQAAGTFAPGKAYHAGTDWLIKSLAAADLNGDGRVDLALGIAASDRDMGIRILLNKGGGTFAPSVLYPTYDPKSLVAKDLNGDGRPDLALTGTTVAGASVLLNQGDGTFASPTTYLLPALSDSRLINAIDVDSDGKDDLVVANAYLGSRETVSVLLNRGNGAFAASVAYPIDPVPDFPVAGQIPVSILSADVNGDKRLDVIATTPYVVTTLLNQGAGRLTGPVAYSFMGSTAAVMDFTGDGMLDIAVAGIQGIAVYPNDGSGQFPGIGTRYELPTVPWSLSASDLNADGRPDLVASNIDRSTMTVLMNRGDGTFAAPTRYSSGTMGSTRFDDQPADIDGDGMPDLLLASENGAIVFPNRGDGTFARGDSFDVGAVLAAADLDGNGRCDLVTVDTDPTQTSRPLRVLLDAPPGFSAPTSYFVGTNPASAAAADVDGDGKRDLVVAGDGLTVLFNQGGGRFGSGVSYEAAFHASTLTVADVNGDGKVDLAGVWHGSASLDPPVTGPTSSLVTVLLNTGDGTFRRGLTFPTQDNPSALRIGDLDADGRADLIVSAGAVNLGFGACL
jgi:hypothetical protein